MSAKHKETLEDDSERRENQRVTDVVGRQVMDQMGRPADFQRLQVSRLWADHYRVNVFAGADAASVRLIESYFIVADSAGGIVTSVPAIRRLF